MCSPCHAALNSILAEIAGLCQGVVIKKKSVAFLERDVVSFLSLFHRQNPFF